MVLLCHPARGRPLVDFEAAAMRDPGLNDYGSDIKI